MKPVKSSVHPENISGLKITTLGIFIDQVSENDIKDVKKDVFWIFRGMKR